jgi:hypothetical protein
MAVTDDARLKYGKRFIVNIIDARAQAEPNKEWISVPKSSHPKDRWKLITYKQASNAINLLAHKIAKQLEGTNTIPTDGSFPTIGTSAPTTPGAW